MKKLFITFEGGEGSGKTTQINLLKEYFENNNYSVVTTREPGGSLICEQIRAVLKDGNNGKMGKMTELLLFSAARSQHAEDIIVPALERGDIVLCDRFYDSSIVYQGYGRGLGEKTVREVTRFAIGALEPTLTFYLNIDPETAFRRKNGPDNDRFETSGLEFHKTVQAGYLKLAKKEKRIRVIDASKTMQEVFDQIIEVLKAEKII
ncbi:MAG: dTMP kinase [Spirochaetales bacterium]